MSEVKHDTHEGLLGRDEGPGAGRHVKKAQWVGLAETGTAAWHNLKLNRERPALPPPYPLGAGGRWRGRDSPSPFLLLWGWEGSYVRFLRSCVGTFRRHRMSRASLGQWLTPKALGVLFRRLQALRIGHGREKSPAAPSPGLRVLRTAWQAGTGGPAAGLGSLPAAPWARFGGLAGTDSSTLPTQEGRRTSPAPHTGQARRPVPSRLWNLSDPSPHTATGRVPPGRPHRTGWLCPGLVS